MFFVLDNYDSFTYNLVQYLGELEARPEVRRNDEVSVADVLALDPEAVIVSPGPGRPAEAGVSISLIRACEGRVPVLGVCLGHQAIGEAFGARIVRADRLMHGKTTPVSHDGSGVLAGLPDPFEAMRYHSLVIDPATMPDVLSVVAWSADRPVRSEIMGVAHRGAPIWGVQFHPESIGTGVGFELMRNFVRLVRGG